MLSLWRGRSPSVLRGRAFWLTLALVLLARLVFFVTYPTSVAGDGVTYFRMMATRSSSLMHAQGYPLLVTLALAGPRAVVRALAGPDWAGGGDPPGVSDDGAAGPVSAPAAPPPHRAVSSATSRAPGAGPDERAAAAQPAEDDEREADSAGATGAKQAWLARAAGVFNHAVGVLGAVALFWLLRVVFTTGAAVVGTLAYALNPWQLQWAAHTRPESVQADLWLVTLALAVRAFRVPAGPAKWRAWAVTATSFGVTMLVKGNVLFLAPLLMALLAADALDGRARLGVAGMAAGLVAVTYAAFLGLYHTPSTGSLRLSYEPCQILWDRVAKYAPQPLDDPANGLETRKLAILRRVLPASFPCCGTVIFPHVDAVSPGTRAPWRDLWRPLVYSRDADYVGHLWDSVRDRPAGPYASVQYFLGLPEADRLLCGTFREAVRARPGAYLTSAWPMLARDLPRSRRVLVPIDDSRLDPSPGVAFPAAPGAREPVAFGFARVAETPRSRVVAYEGRPLLWLPGVNLVTRWLGATAWPLWVPWALAAAAALLLASPWRPRAAALPGLARWGPLAILLVIGVYVVAWAHLLHVRNKDLRLVLPLVEIIAALGLWRAAALAGSALRGQRPA